MKNLKSKIRLWYCFILILLFFIPGFSFSQDPGNYSAFRKEVAQLILDYKLEEALGLCNNSDERDRENIAAKSVIYSLMGNRDKNNNYIEEGFNMLQPFRSHMNDYNIQVALAVSYGIQANHSGLKKKAEFGQLSVRHSKEALRLEPNLPHPNFIPGRFYFELAGMNFATAMIAKSVIDKEEIERASYELALTYLEKASKLAPGRFLYNYYTGAAYKKLGNEEMAMYYFRLADKNVRHTSDDHEANKDLIKQIK